jgi:hypothetical protein
MSRAEAMHTPSVKAPLWKPLLLTLVGFVLLDAYYYLPLVLGPSPTVYVAVYVSFFLVAHVWSRLTGGGGLRGYGFFRHTGWGRNVALGFAAGLAFQGLGYGAEWALGGFRVEGFIAAGPLVSLLAMAAFGMFLSSATDDILIRGYLFRHLSSYVTPRVLILGTTAVYVLNHVFYAKLTPLFCLRLALLGLVFAYALARTGSLWLAIGLHWGGNVMYRLRNGFDPQQGGIVRLTELSQPGWFDWLGVGATALMLAASLLLVRWAVKAEPPSRASEAPEAGAAPALSPSA